MSQKAIAVLTSGGDAPGMNAAFRAVVRAGISKGMRVYGIYRGYNGLLHGDSEENIQEMNLRSVSEIIGNGGTKLYTARCKEFEKPEVQRKAAEFLIKKGIDGLVVIGGDGSFRGARALANTVLDIDGEKKSVKCIGVPGTIDNDIACSEYTVGFDTAMNTALQMIDRIRDTAQSHDRCSVVQVMGRHCGDIALQTGIAVGATAILVPEVKYNIERDVITRIVKTQKTGKQHFIVVVAEGVGGVRDLAKYIEQRLGIEARATILGHVQRGGSPTLRDRVVASQMGYKAVELLDHDVTNRVVVMQNGKITDLDINDALNMERVFDEELYNIAMTISI